MNRPRITRAFKAAGRIATLVPAFVLGLAPSLAVEPTTTFRATYVIALGGVVVGHAEAESRFTGNGYSAAIKGSTSGVTRFVSDASARLTGTGKIAGSQVLPSSYNLETKENGFATHVAMEMRSGRVTDVVAMPRLPQTADRIPVTPSHKANVVDPMGAFIVPNTRPGIPIGRLVCNRTVKVFDGWTRFDVRLFYKETKAVDGSAGSYVGRVIVCGAQYIPVAGHRTTRDAAASLAANRRMEVWLVPVENMPILVPYRILIGTSVGDIMIYATRFAADGSKQRAAAD